MTELLKGAPVAKAIKEDVACRVGALKKTGVEPTLAILRVGQRGDDIAYESSILKSANALGINVNVFAEDASAPNEQLLSIVDEINGDESIHGCLIFRPLPQGIDEDALCERLCVDKDIDGCTPQSLASVFMDSDTGFAPATACACMEILKYYGYNIAGKDVAVIGRSLVIGKPVAMLALKDNATVSIAHSKSADVSRVMRGADIVVCAVGKANFFDRSYFSEGQCVIDVGMNVSEDGSLVGDVDTDDLLDVARAITPVPGGVGSVTTAVLLEHVVKACESGLGR